MVRDQETSTKQIIIVALIGLIIAGILFLTGGTIYATHKYAATIPEVYKLYTKDNSKLAKSRTPNIVDNIILTDIDQVKEPMLLLMYKVNCPYCEALHPILESNVNEITDKKIKKNIAYVNVESKLGKELVKKYNIEVAATIVLIQKDGTVINYTPADKIDGKFVVDEDYTKSIFKAYAAEFSR